ncbi:NIF-domain-containing protein [Pleurotus eryngii]|uniref:NIF-domain-containing protein n=1 Tax=Pleurotus eryngii TaxID=5323 RepID=A0A9P6A4V5_PLEER|nr:NIF-domain-containing protein [Pleurotus eryngii]
MNSLTYLSRQFDVLASAKTPPSIPAAAESAFLEHGVGEGALKRSWSTRSFFFPPPRKSGRASPPPRSHSSPSEFPALASLRPRASSSKTASPTPKLSQTRVQAVVRFIRVFAAAWDALCSTWVSFTTRLRWWSTSEGSIHFEISEKGKEVVRDIVVEEHPSLGRHHTDPPHVGNPLSSQVHPSSNNNPPNESGSSSRSQTPMLTRKPQRVPRKTLVLDLDETLIHSTSRPMPMSGSSGFFGFGRRNNGPGHTVEVILGGKRTVYHVYKRPFADFFLRTVSSWYTLVIFTASMQEYADPVIDWLDAGRGILGRRLFRDSCTQLPSGTYSKDLAVVEQDLSNVCLIDNSPISYRINEANGIPIEGWTNDPSDEALLDLLPVLDSLRFTNDVRRVLSLRTAGGVSFAS